MNFDPKDFRAVQNFVQDALTGDPENVSIDEIRGVVAPSQQMNAVQRLSVYRNGYYARLLECMRGQYRVLCNTLGAELFDDFAIAYLHDYPSRSYTLHELGKMFPAYLQQTRPDADLPEAERESWIDFMIDLAAFEWEVYTVFDMPGSDAPYASADSPAGKIQLAPTTLLREFRYPVNRYYKLDDQHHELPAPPPQQTFLALYRIDFHTGVFELDAEAWTLLHSIARDGNAAAAISSDEALAACWMKNRNSWLEHGFFVESD